jgi:selenocysteine lyase/cysteine desulfurase
VGISQYAKYFSESLALDKAGGYVRIGVVHYNTVKEVDKVTQILGEISAKNLK